MLNFILNEHFVELVEHLAWPVTTIILLFLTRKLITRIASAIADRIKDPRSGVELPYGVKFHPVNFEETSASEKLSNRIKADPSFAESLMS